MEMLLKKLGLWERLGEIENPIFWWYFIVFLAPLLIVLSIPLYMFFEAKFLFSNFRMMRKFFITFLISLFSIIISLYFFGSILYPNLMDKVAIAMLGMFIIINISSYQKNKKAIIEAEQGN